ncbi:MAG: hypothetical protein H7318_07635 [Oligoflexus sp.]|nr:hypothetical protein [Oligoflexus sp.]
MGNSLNPRILFQVDKVFLSEHFVTNDVFQLLGKPLTALIVNLLREHGVTDQPVIKGKVSPHAILEGAVYIAEGAEVGPFAYIQGPTFIGPGAEVRHGAFIRGSAYIGAKAVVGHTTEVKGSIFFDEAKAGHFAYVGDSILGHDVNLGAGTKLANLKLRGNEVSVIHPETDAKLASGLRKLGALIGDKAQTGCNAVLSPGSILMPSTGVLPCVHYLGTLKRGFAKG